MNTPGICWLATLMGFLLANACHTDGYCQEEAVKKRVINRVSRPHFDRQAWDGIYFEDLFRDGLVGERPADFGAPKPSTANADANPTPPPSENSHGWSQLVSAQVLEDEVKALNGQLDTLISTPTKFKSENSKVSDAFFQLAFLFGVISEYDQNVRWKESAPAARAAFARAAANARTTTDQAFNNARSQKENLAEMVRGGKFNAGAGLEEISWSDWADRSPLMDRLELAFDKRIKPWTSNESEFKSHLEEVEHEASLVAALGNVLLQPGLEDADDQDYGKHAHQMISAAQRLTKAARDQAFAAVAEPANSIGQSCSNCHEGFR